MQIKLIVLPVTCLMSSMLSFIYTITFEELITSEYNQVFDSVPKRHIDLKVTKSIKLVSFQKQITLENVDDEVASPCKNWKISRVYFLELLKHFEPITSEAQNLIFYDLPCRYTGKIIINNESFDFKLNSGSWLVIYNKQKVFYYGMFKEVYLKFFLQGPDK